MLLEGILRDGKHGKNQLADDQVEVLLLRPLYLTSKYGHKFSVDGFLSRDLNQKPAKYEHTRTRLNKENKAKVREEIKSSLSNTNSDIYPDVSIRGIQGRVYHDTDTNRVGGIHTEGEFAGQIMKVQPISERQLESVRELNILD